MSILLRSLLFLSFGIVVLVAESLYAQAPPLPAPPRPNNAQLERLTASVSSSGITHPQPAQSVQQDIRLPEQLPPQTQQPIGLATFASRPLPSSHSPLDTATKRTQSEFSNEVPPEDSFFANEYEETDEHADIHYAVLDRSLGARKPVEFGDETDQTETGGWKNKLTMPNFAPIVSVGGTLLIVIAAFFLLALFLRKVSPQSNRVLPKEAFECLGRYYLTQKHQVQLLRVGSRIVLVSVMPDGVSTLAEVTDPDEAVSLLGLCRRLDHNSATEFFRKTVANLSEAELSRPSQRPVAATRRGGQPAASLDLYSEPDESLATILARGRQYGR